MKKCWILLICIVLSLAMLLVACESPNDDGKPTPVEEQPVFVTFVVDGYEVEDIPALVCSKGAFTLPALPDIDALGGVEYELCWYLDEARTAVATDVLMLDADITLYLGEQGKEYAISYAGYAGVDFEGTFVEHYRYGNGVELPVAMRDGVLLGGWTVEGRMMDGFWVSIPAYESGDLHLIWTPHIPTYPIRYKSGIAGVDVADILLNNPSEYLPSDADVLVLAAAEYEGRVFVRWEIDYRGETRTFEVDGESITLVKDTQVPISRLSRDMIGALVARGSALVPIWE